LLILKTGVMKTRIISLLMVLMLLMISAKIEKQPPLLKSALLKDFVEIESGNVIVGSERQFVQGFFISKYEITNQQYLAFLQSLKEQGDIENLEVARVKQEYWKKLNVIDFTEGYHNYHGFAAFPVVNVSYEGAMLYCQWLEDQINLEFDHRSEIEVRLPNRNEWIRAARGERQDIYAWQTPYLMDEKGKYHCNFKRLGAELIHYDADLDEYRIINNYDGPDVTITTKAGAFKPNCFGLFDMCGNVAEMISEPGIAVGGSFESPGYDVRIESKHEYEDASPCVGFRPVVIVKKN
jgi:formylglycine-generating enzyme required for sulfatase activity